MRRLGALLLLLLLALASAAGATHYTRLSRRLPEAYQNAPAPSPAAPADPLADHVLVLVLGGLRDDTSWRLASLQYLAAQGLAVPVWAAAPAQGPVNWQAMFSGSEPAVLPSVPPQRQPSDTILQRAVAAGLTVDVAGAEPFLQIAPAGATTRRLPDDPDAALAAVTADWLERRPALSVARLGWLEDVGRQHPPNSREYLEQAAVLDAALIRFLRSFSQSGVTLIVAGDHGQLDDGRQGGHELTSRRTAWVMAGPGLQTGWRPTAGAAVPQAGLAALLGGLLGLPLPADASTAAGQQLLALPAAGPAEAQARARWQAASATLARRLAATIAATPVRDGSDPAPAPPPPALAPTLAEAEADHERLAAALKDAQAAKARADRLQLLPFTASAAAVLLAVLAFLLSGPGRGPLVLGLALYVGGWLTLWLGPWSFGPFYTPHGGGLDWSSLPAPAGWASYLRQRLFETSLLAGATAGLGGWLTARQRSAEARARRQVQTPAPAAYGLQLAAALCALLGLGWLAVFTLTDSASAVAVPDPRLWHALQLLGLQLQVTGYGAAALAAAAGFGGAFHLRHVPGQALTGQTVIMTRPRRRPSRRRAR